MNIVIAADHAGFQMKEDLKRYLADLGYEIQDVGPEDFKPDDDYPDFILPAAQVVALRQAQGDNDVLGIVIGGSGQGEAIAANKVKGIRAAVVYDEYSARMSREDNDANVISLGARVLDLETAKRLVKIWLETSFSRAERHTRRIKKIAEAEASV